MHRKAHATGSGLALAAVTYGASDASSKGAGSIPGTRVTDYSGDLGNTFGAKRFSPTGSTRFSF